MYRNIFSTETNQLRSVYSSIAHGRKVLAIVNYYGILLLYTYVGLYYILHVELFHEMKLLLVLLVTSLLSSSALLTTDKPPFQCNNYSNNNNEGIYTVYDTANGILHVASFVGEPTFLIYSTPNGTESLNIRWNDTKFESVTLSGYKLLYGFVVRNLIEFKVASAGIHFDLGKFVTNRTGSFNITSFSNLKYNITHLPLNCNETGRINISLHQQNISSNLTQLDILFSLQAYSTGGRLDNQPRYSYRGNNSVIDVVIKNYQYNLTTAATPASRLALELDFITLNNSKLSFTSKKNIDDEFTPAVFIQNSLSIQRDRFLYWKPIAYADSIRTVENSMMVTYLNGTYNNTREQLNTTGFYHSLQNSINSTLERSFFIFGTDGDSTLNTDYLYFRMELGLGVPPTDSISLPLIIAIGVGFGLPVFGLILGIIGLCFFLAYKCCFRKRTSNARYVMIN